MGINKLLKDLHYLSIGIAEARLTLADIKENSGEKCEFDNVALTLFGANTNIETAIDNLYRIAEGRKLRAEINSPK